MMKKITMLFLGIVFLFAACEKKYSIESLYRDAEKMEGEILKSVSTIAQCRSNYEKILMEAPESELAPLACYKLAKLNEIFGHYEDAINFYRKLLVQYPAHPICAEGLFNMAQIYPFHIGSDEAITAYTQLVHFYTEEKVSCQGLLHLGQLLSQEEKWEDVVYYFQKIIETFPDQPIGDDLYFRMGDILQHKIKDPTRAIRMYEAVMKKYPNSSWVKFAQQRLEALRQRGEVR